MKIRSSIPGIGNTRVAMAFIRDDHLALAGPRRAIRNDSARRLHEPKLCRCKDSFAVTSWLRPAAARPDGPRSI